MNAHAAAASRQTGSAERASERRFGGWLALWMILAVGSNAFLWSTGLKEQALIDAVEEGAAGVEARSVKDDLEAEQIRKSIKTQRDTLPFWRTLAWGGDFVLQPLTLPLRALAITVSFAAMAALTGRPVGYEAVLQANIRWQGWWVAPLLLGAALRAWSPDAAETSLVLLLPPGVHSATLWLPLSQLDFFAIFGWLAVAWGGYRRRQANGVVAILIVLCLASLEVALRGSILLGIGATIRLSMFG